jgi:hypothetical protein
MMADYDLESKSKNLRGVLDSVKKLSQSLKHYNNLIALDGSHSSDKTEILSIFDNISSAIKPFEYEDDSDIVFLAETIAEEMKDVRDYFVEDYLTDFEINEYTRSFSEKIEEILANLRTELLSPVKPQHSYDHSEVKEARYA